MCKTLHGQHPVWRYAWDRALCHFTLVLCSCSRQTVHAAAIDTRLPLRYFCAAFGALTHQVPPTPVTGCFDPPGHCFSLAGIHIRGNHRTLVVEAGWLLHLGYVLTVLQAVPPAGRASNGMRDPGLALLSI